MRRRLATASALALLARWAFIATGGAVLDAGAMRC